MSLPDTRKILDAIHSGELVNAPTQKFPIFNFDVPTTCTGVNPDILWPQKTWSSQEEFDKNLKALATAFINNFKKFEKDSSPAIKAAGPSLR